MTYDSFKEAVRYLESIKNSNEIIYCETAGAVIVLTDASCSKDRVILLKGFCGPNPSVFIRKEDCFQPNLRLGSAPGNLLGKDHEIGFREESDGPMPLSP